jgi:rod shape-determining protein MreC
MTALLATRAARRRTITFAILVGLSLLMMAISRTAPVGELQRGVGFAMRPFQEAAAGAANTVSSVVASLSEIDRLRRTNRELAAENQRLATQNAQLQEVARENDQLAALLAVRSAYAYKTVVATVIARERPDVGRTITIDRGSNDGIAQGDVVIAAGGALAGRVTDIGSTSAHVTLINSPSSTVIGQVQGNRATGEVVGQLGGVLVMQNVDATERVTLGDQIVTAGIELGPGVRSPYPKGLLIGQVFDVERDANAVVQTAFLQPTVDLDKLEYLLVVTDYQGGLPQGGSPSCVPNPDGTLPVGEQTCPTFVPRVSPSPKAKP